MNDSYNDKKKQRLRRRKHWISLYKVKKGCEMCGYNKHFSALHFDHSDRSTKVEKVSKMVKHSLKNLILEIRKCNILCANCHSEKTYREKDYEHLDL